MYEFDPYDNNGRSFLDDPQNCFQSAIRIVEAYGTGDVYWLPEQEHFYVVVTGQEYAIGERNDKPKLRASYVVQQGELQDITDGDLALWG